MSRLKSAMHKNKEALNTRTAKVGGYSFIMAVVVLAILIAVNVAVGALPSTWTHYDISAARLYSVTSATKAVVQNLNEDVTVYWITQDGSEDSVIEKLLDVYDALSDHLIIQKVNPDVYPTFAAQYTDETVSNNSLVVVSGERSRYVAYSDIYDVDYSSYYTTGSVAYSFDGEGAITTAVDYVTKEELPVLYLTTGHGETELSDNFAEAIEKQNIETADFSLLTVDEIPEDADAVLINAPSSDFAAEEVDMLSEYLDEGGKLLVISGPQQEETFPNLHELLTKYGITVAEGMVLETDRSTYALGYPYMIIPTLGDSDITAELSENNDYIIAAIAQGLTASSSSSATVTPLLTSSDTSFSKTAGYSLETFEKEDEDIDGPFDLAVSVEDSTSGGMMIWIASDDIMDDLFVSYSSGANQDFVMNSISSLIGETDAISIRSKSLNYSTLTINTAQATRIKVCLIALIPLLVLALGAEEVFRRRRQSS